VQRNGTKILTDNGRTLAFLDKVFELTEPDVIKNIRGVTELYKVGIIITDTGCTYDNLDDVFVLSETDVIKNIVTVLRCYDMVKVGKSFICRLEPSKAMLSQIMHFLCGTQYLYATKVFYV